MNQPTDLQPVEEIRETGAMCEKELHIQKSTKIPKECEEIKVSTA